MYTVQSVSVNFHHSLGHAGWSLSTVEDQQNPSLHPPSFTHTHSTCRMAYSDTQPSPMADLCAKEAIPSSCTNCPLPGNFVMLKPWGACISMSVSIFNSRQRPSTFVARGYVNPTCSHIRVQMSYKGHRMGMNCASALKLTRFVPPLRNYTVPSDMNGGLSVSNVPLAIQSLSLIV